MASQCAVCSKSSQMEGKRKLLRGHYNPTTKRRKYANLQLLRIDSGKRIKICTRCMKTAVKKPEILKKVQR